MTKLKCVLDICFCVLLFLLPQTAMGQTVASDSTIQKSDTTVVKEVNRKKASVNRSDLLKGNISRTRNFNEIPDVDDLRSVNEGTIIGFGSYMMKDTYLSPMEYNGYGMHYMNERMKFTGAGSFKWSRQSIVNVDISSALNGAENANFLSAFVDYSYGLHYRILPSPFFKILVGGSTRGMLGMVYNTRNGNNPMTLHADIDLNASMMAIYEFRIRKHQLALRYQIELPFAGVLFSPVYNQSYYEIFSLGNTQKIFNFNSLSNKFAIRNYFYLDFPIGGMTLRAGYYGMIYSTNINKIERYIASNNVMLGVVKEFVALGGRELKRRNLFISAYY
ncbi:MAG: DUF3316 domain-containing protein [Tannerella sp.]|jgi:hypothetical protein|nr:DUF3316 domain-containing protein [Tannerella sp.]